jgi:hypothetical protein
MTQTDLSQTPNGTGTDERYAKVTEVAAALNRHERTIRGYICLLREDFGHPDFLEKLNGRSLNSRQQQVLADLAQQYSGHN